MQSNFEQNNLDASPTRGKQVILQQRDSDHAKIHVGREFQADIPESRKRGFEDSKDRELCVWSPSVIDNLAVDDLLRYLALAKDSHGFGEEQALAFLHFHKYDLRCATEDLKNYTHCPTQWSVEDQIAFSEAFSYAGKNFNSIQKLMPHKTLGDLVTYYYKWKKNRNIVSTVMERHHKDQDLTQSRLINRSGADNGSDGRSSDSDCDYPRVRLRQRYNKRRGGNNSRFRNSDSANRKGSKRSGASSVASDSNQAGSSRSRLRPPRNFHLNVEEYRTFVSVPQSDTENAIRNLINETKETRAQLQQLKQKVERLASCAVDSVSGLRPPSLLRNSTSQWSRTEIFLFLEAFRRYGKDFQMISDIVASKTANQVESFYLSVRRRYRLDEIRTGNDADNLDAMKKQRNSFEKLK